jgi:hypothetical protein
MSRCELGYMQSRRIRWELSSELRGPAGLRIATEQGYGVGGEIGWQRRS